MQKGDWLECSKGGGERALLSEGSLQIYSDEGNNTVRLCFDYAVTGKVLYKKHLLISVFLLI